MCCWGVWLIVLVFCVVIWFGLVTVVSVVLFVVCYCWFVVYLLSWLGAMFGVCGCVVICFSGFLCPD